jgi:hypothetical protein
VTTPSRLEKLFIGEVSLVDDPANESPGFMVAKATEAEPELESEDPTSLLGKIRDLLKGSGKEDIDMTKEELHAELDEKLAPLAELTSKVDELISKSVEAPAPAGEVETESTEAEAENALTEEVVKSAIEAGIKEALEPVFEVLEKTLDRLEAVESKFVTRKSLEGQETSVEDGTEATPTLSDAIAKALKSPTRA